MAQVTFQGHPLELENQLVKIGDQSPDFDLVSLDLKKRTLADYKNKIKVLSVFPSLDTPVCDLQVKEFNKRASNISKDVVVLCISKDLPFAQKRFCEVNGIKNVEALSDYKFASMKNYGLHIKNLCLLARAVVIIDQTDKVRYIQLVGEVTEHVDYNKAFEALKNIVK